MNDIAKPAINTNAKPVCIDLFCSAGGVAVGLKRAGFEVIGVDIEPQKNFPYEFHQADALEYPLDGADFVWASPPCQFATALRHAPNAKKHPNLIPATREKLEASGLPYIIENVEEARSHLIDPILLCGTMFGLGVMEWQLQRHRLFESNLKISAPGACSHTGPCIGVYGGHVRCRSSEYWRGGADFPGYDKPKLAAVAMGLYGMTMNELSQAIPPAYTEHLGKQILPQL